MTFCSLLLALLLGLLTLPPSVRGQGSLARKPVAELLEYLTRKSGAQGARELEHLGGERAVREIVEKAVAESGESAAEQITRTVAKHGPSTLHAIKAEPAAMLRALAKMPDDLATRAVAEAARSPELVGRLVKTYGDDALLVSARHPGVGSQVIDRFGAAGLNAGKTLNTSELIILQRAKGYEALSAADRDLFTRLFNRSPRQFYNALLVAGGGTAIYLTASNLNEVATALVGTPGQPGVLVTTLETSFRILAALLLGGLALYIALKLRPKSPPSP